MWGRILNAFLLFVYPPHCLLCKASLLQHVGLCESCAKGAGCTAQEQGVHLWLEGMDVYVLKEFDDNIRQLIHLLKYRSKRIPGRLLGRFLGQTIRRHLELDNSWIVVPIPLHSARLRERGYNQSAIIAKALADELDLAVVEKAMERIRHTPSQTRFNKVDRLHNVTEAFHVRDVQRIKGRGVVLVDDVVTTGATVKAGVEALQKAGARCVVVAAVARPELGEDKLQDL